MAGRLGGLVAEEAIAAVMAMVQSVEKVVRLCGQAGAGGACARDMRGVQRFGVKRRLMPRATARMEVHRVSRPVVRRELPCWL